MTKQKHRSLNGNWKSKEWVRQYHRDYANTLRGFMRRMRASMLKRSNEKKTALGQAPNTGESIITFNELMRLYERQNGYCYYFKTKKMRHENHSEWMMTPERLDNSKDYTSDNTVLCCYEFNTRRQWSIESIDNIVHLRQTTVDMNSFRDEVTRGSGPILTFIDALMRTLRHAHTRSKPKECTVTRETFIDLINSQDGRCRYSGIPLVFEQNSKWQASPERLDNSQGYHAFNVVLICLEFNSSCPNLPASDDRIGAQWTLNKAAEFLSYVECK